MSSDRVEYPLLGRFDYMRQPRLSTLLIALGKHVGARERAGETGEHVAIWADYEGDWSGVVLLQDPNNPPVEVA